MRNKLLFVCLFLFASLASCKDTRWAEIAAGNPPEGAVTGESGELTENEEEPVNPDDPDVPQNPDKYINSSYIRGDYFEFERISAATMAACNDLIYLAPRPYADGELGFDLPVNDATFTGGAAHEASFSGRNGVVKFDGSGKMNGGIGLIENPDADYKDGIATFTFGTWLYITDWVKNAHLFDKSSAGGISVASLRLGDAAGSLKLTVGSTTVSATQASLKAGEWCHVAVTYDKGTAKLIVNGNNTANFSGATLPAKVENTRGNFVIGKDFKGYLDETYVSNMGTAVGTGELSFSAGNWNAIKVLAYWKYNDASKPGKDSHTWVERLNNIRKALEGQSGDRKLRAGVAGGDWKAMVADAAARTKFANNIKKLINDYQLDGVDLDFEWPGSSAEYSSYSAAIVEMRSVLGSNVCFTVSLHPVAYKISKAAIDVLDFISYQCYGPAVMRFPYEQFVKDGKEAVTYGIPKEKLVMGVPFYGSKGTAAGTTGYWNLVTESPQLSDTSLDIWNGYTFNGQSTIRKKTQHVCDEGYAGIMSWDLATDVDVTHPKSLLKVVKEVFETYVPTTEQK